MVYIFAFCLFSIIIGHVFAGSKPDLGTELFQQDSCTTGVDCGEDEECNFAPYYVRFYFNTTGLQLPMSCHCKPGFLRHPSGKGCVVDDKYCHSDSQCDDEYEICQPENCESSPPRCICKVGFARKDGSGCTFKHCHNFLCSSDEFCCFPDNTDDDWYCAAATNENKFPCQSAFIPPLLHCEWQKFL